MRPRHAETGLYPLGWEDVDGEVDGSGGVGVGSAGRAVASERVAELEALRAAEAARRRGLNAALDAASAAARAGGGGSGPRGAFASWPAVDDEQLAAMPPAAAAALVTGGVAALAPEACLLLQRGASLRTCEARFRQLARLLHPDRVREAGALEACSSAFDAARAAVERVRLSANGT